MERLPVPDRQRQQLEAKRSVNSREIRRLQVRHQRLVAALKVTSDQLTQRWEVDRQINIQINSSKG